MPRVSAADKLERSTIERLQAMIENPLTPLYVQHRCMATLATMVRHRDKRKAEKRKASAARKAAEPMPIYNVLPRNGREPPDDWNPAHARPFVIPKGINKG
jgi:hypothetical protein